MSDTNLRLLWDAIMDVYEEYRKICQRHNLRFYAAYGTAIGAVRHKGFIPWDDDFDVIMPQCDYDQFLKIAPKELPEHLKMITAHNTPEFGCYFGKVQDCRREVSEQIALESGHPQKEGVFIDVFPFCGIPEKKRWDWVDRVWIRIRARSILRDAGPTLASKFAFILGRMLAKIPIRPRNLGELSEIIYDRSHVVSFDNAERVGPYNSNIHEYGDSKTLAVGYDRRLFDSMVWMPFENTKIPLMSGYDVFLREHYGDYMKLPPIDKRVFAHKNVPVAAWRYGPTLECDP